MKLISARARLVLGTCCFVTCLGGGDEVRGETTACKVLICRFGYVVLVALFR